jgi:DNA adenine methylase
VSHTEIPALARGTVSILSPLRYPGGKRRLAGYVAEALRLNDLRPKLYVEPFAGGASVALQLLNDGLVERIALGEKDPLVASFWKTVFFDHEWLTRELRKIEPTLEAWNRFRNGRPRSDRSRALACIFLNRTSFSGILSATAGPIGGQAQSSDYAIGCRFPVETIIRRIEQAAALGDRVAFVHEGDWRETIERVKSLRVPPRRTLYYLDPPFYEKAERLYRYYFLDGEHQALHDALASIRGNYILSYDAVAPIVDLYSRNGIGPAQVEMLYSATKPGELLRTRELIVSNLPELPKETRMWRTVEEWRQ